MSATQTVPNPKPQAGLTLKELYDNGSRTCQQYTQLTKDVRTQAIQLLATYAVAVGLILSKFLELGNNSKPLIVAPILGLVLGTVMLVFSRLQRIANQHYSDAFRAVRGALIRLENDVAPIGSRPWEAHDLQRQKEETAQPSGSRPEQNYNPAWHASSNALFHVGWVTIVLAVILGILIAAHVL